MQKSLCEFELEQGWKTTPQSTLRLWWRWKRHGRQAQFVFAQWFQPWW